MPTDLKSDQSAVEPARAKSKRGGVLLVKLIVIGTTVIAAGEASWRWVGVQRRSDLLSFAEQVKEARNSGKAVAMLGSSRMLCDVVPEVFQRAMPELEFHQLAIPGTPAVPMLEIMAKDESFHGQVICEFHPSYVTDTYNYPQGGPNEDSHAKRYLNYIQGRPGLDFASVWFDETLNREFALAAHEDWDYTVPLERTLRRLCDPKAAARDHQLLAPQLVHRESRFIGLRRRSADWHDTDSIRALSETIAKRTRLRTNDGRRFQQLVEWSQAIRRRGGDIVFVRLPVTGSARQTEDRVYPDVERIREALASNRITLIDFSQEPSLSGFRCPEDSHLYEDDAERFSAALVQIFEDRQLLKTTAAGVR